MSSSRELRTLLVLFAAGSWLGALRAQSSGDIPLRVFDEASPESPAAEAARPFQDFHDALVSEPPRVLTHPVMGPNPVLFPLGWTGGIDDPSGSRNEALHHSWTNLGVLAYTQHTMRRYRRERGTRIRVAPTWSSYGRQPWPYAPGGPYPYAY